MKINKAAKVEATKQFPVSVEKLYRAWTDPDQLKQWWKPMGKRLKEVTNDLKEGGKVSYSFEDQAMAISGQYEEVKQNERLEYTWNWEFTKDPEKNAAYKLTVQFTGDEATSEILVKQEKLQSGENFLPNEEGWDKGLSDLESYLAGSNEHETSRQNNVEKKVSEEPGYREMPEQQKVGGG